MSDSPPRYTQLPLPPYSYVPGHHPHPVSDPAGHMHGIEHAEPPPLDPTAWQNSEPYRYGIDLFNHGYYWEAHEAWESLWHAAGRQGETANFLKGLIKLAAAGVKAREGNPRGVQRHAQRSQELIASVQHPTYSGLDLNKLVSTIQDLTATASAYSNANPNLQLNIHLTPTAATNQHNHH